MKMYVKFCVEQENKKQAVTHASLPVKKHSVSSHTVAVKMLETRSETVVVAVPEAV